MLERRFHMHENILQVFAAPFAGEKVRVALDDRQRAQDGHHLIGQMTSRPSSRGLIDGKPRHLAVEVGEVAAQAEHFGLARAGAHHHPRGVVADGLRGSSLASAMQAASNALSSSGVR